MSGILQKERKTLFCNQKDVDYISQETRGHTHSPLGRVDESLCWDIACARLVVGKDHLDRRASKSISASAMMMVGLLAFPSSTSLLLLGISYLCCIFEEPPYYLHYCCIALFRVSLDTREAHWLVRCVVPAVVRGKDRSEDLFSFIIPVYRIYAPPRGCCVVVMRGRLVDAIMPTTYSTSLLQQCCCCLRSPAIFNIFLFMTHPMDPLIDRWSLRDHATTVTTLCRELLTGFTEVSFFFVQFEVIGRIPRLKWT